MEQALKSAVGLVGETSLSLDDFDGLVASMQTRIYRLLLGMLRDPEAAQTLTQDCFLKAYQRRDSYRGDASLSTWVTQIAVNLARDYHRNRKAQFWRRLFQTGDQYEVVAAATPDAKPSHESALVAQGQLAAVWQAVDTLPAQQRAVFVLRFAEDQGMEEIAASLGLKVGTVKMHLFRAVRAVRATVKDARGGL